MLPENKKRDVINDLTVKTFLLGEPYSGKTTFASKFDEPIILSSDGNYKFLDTPAITITKIKDLEEAIIELRDTKHTYKTVIVDVVDMFYEMKRQEILNAHNVTDEQDLGGYGKGYNMVRDPFKKLVRDLALLDMNVIFIGHTQTVTQTNKYKQEITVTSSVLPDKLYKYITGLVDFTFHIYKGEDDEGEEKRFINLNSVGVDAVGGSRIQFQEDVIEADYDLFMQYVKEGITGVSTKIVDKVTKPKESVESKPKTKVEPKATPKPTPKEEVAETPTKPKPKLAPLKPVK